jgi:DNA-binding beta-propeller fold protein YncE
MSFLDQFDLQSAGDPVSNSPVHVTVDPDETAYVTYLREQVIQVYSGRGQLLYQFGPSGAPEGQFQFPRGVALGPDGNLYITDFQGRIQVYTTRGTPVGHWGEAGSADGQFQVLSDVVFDPTSGDVFVLEEEGSRVQRFAFPVALEPTTWSRVKQLYRD